MLVFTDEHRHRLSILLTIIADEGSDYLVITIATLLLMLTIGILVHMLDDLDGF